MPIVEVTRPNAATLPRDVVYEVAVSSRVSS